MGTIESIGLIILVVFALIGVAATGAVIWLFTVFSNDDEYIDLEQ